MKSKRFLPLTLALGLLVTGCSDSKLDDGISVYPDTAQSGPRLGAIESVRHFARQINSGEIEREEGLFKIGASIKDFSGDWWVIDDEDGQAGNDEPVDFNSKTDELAKIIGGIYGTPVKNLSIILLGTQEEVKGDNILEMLDHLFGVMRTQRADRLSLGEDLLLASFLNTQLFQASNVASGDLRVESALRYYRDRVEYYQSQKYTANDIFKQLAAVERVVESDQDLFYIFNTLIGELKIGERGAKLSRSTQNAYHRILKVVAGPQQKDFSRDALENIFSSAKNLALSTIESSGRETEIHRRLNIVDTYFSLFDRPYVESRFDKKDWIELIDKRSEDVARNFVLSLDHRAINMIRSNPPQHPYTRLLVNRALVFKNNQLWLDRNEFEDVDAYKNLFYQKVSEVHGNDINLNRYQRDPFKKYLMDYYNVEIYRSILEYHSSQKGHTYQIGDLRDEIYSRLMKSLLSALNYRYENNISYEELRRSPRGVQLYDELNSDFMDRADHTFGRNYCQNSRRDCELVLGAGIYSAPEDMDLELFGKSIRFTPLAMIYAPGQDVYLNFEKIEGLWIDTSGRNGDHAIAYDESQNNTTRPVHRTRRNGEYTYYELRVDPISPRQQAAGIYGEDAGQIEIHQPYNGEIHGMPLLVSRGGNGGDGAKGFDAIAQGENSCEDTFEFQIGHIRRYTGKEPFQVCNIGHDGMGIGRCRTDYRDVRKTDRRLRNQTFRLERGQGGDSGDGGYSTRPIIRGGQLDIYLNQITNMIYTPGSAGAPGAGGNCGHGSSSQFMGNKGQDGKVIK